MLARLLRKVLRQDRADLPVPPTLPTNRVDEGAAFKREGDASLKAGDSAQAAQHYRQAVACNPQDARSHFLLGYALRERGEMAEASATLGAALSLDPEMVDAHYVLGSIHQAEGRHAEALRHFHKVLDLDPEAAFVYQDLCRAYIQSGRVDAAHAFVAESLGRNPDSAELRLMSGNILDHECRFAEALHAYDLALRLVPNSPEVLNNRGMTLSNLARYPEALASYEAAQSLRPDDANAHFNEGLCRLLLGDFETGWKKHEWRWKTASFMESKGSYERREFQRPRWQGDESLNGKRILLHAEQGLGDTIQFCRYAQVLAEMGATVLLEVQPALTGLLSDLPGVSQLLAAGQPVPDHDFHCPLMSLPYACKTGLADLPAADGYLGTSSDHRARADRWRSKLGPPTLPRVGIVWSGSRLHQNDAHRSIPFAVFSRLFSDRLHFHCLQNELSASDREQLAQHPQVRLHCDDLVDFSETAALAANMDLVVCVDTSVAHLAGAMGKATWVLVPANPDWRWLLQREDSPWYRSVRLVRQAVLGDWDSVLIRVRGDLDRLAEAGTQLTADA